jgi:dipeptidyl aminopeptidase/acylaminoacyl peptidase
MKQIAFVAALSLGYFSAFGQGVPETDIYLANLKVNKGKVELTHPKNVTQRQGYDNQPNFTPDGRGFLYTSLRSGQTDIYFYDIKAQASIQKTNTSESEYSPALTPDRKFISTVRVEQDGTQRLWKFSNANTEQASLVLEKVKPVGYYVWADASRLALFVLGNQNTGEPHSLYVANAADGKAQKLESNIGRSFHNIPNQKGKVSFIHKVSERQWLVKSLNMATHQIETLIEAPEGSEDIAWTKEGIILATQGTKIYQWNPRTDKGWVEIYDFAALGARQVSRIAIHPENNRIALVVH